MKKYARTVLAFLFLGLSISTTQATVAAPQRTVAQQSDCNAFNETGKIVCGRFLQYWQQHGGLAQQGYPITDVIGERSPIDGMVRTVQYFERAVFEYHPENQPPNDVLLSLLGTFRYQQKYPTGAGGQSPNTSSGSVLFNETGHRVGGGFLSYWQQHGGLAQQGYPISDEFAEKSDLDGQTYVVQYFERAVFEYHPELQTTNKVLLSQLGTFRYRQLSTAGVWTNPPLPVPPAIATPSPTPVPRATSVPTKPLLPTPIALPTTAPSKGGARIIQLGDTFELTPGFSLTWNDFMYDPGQDPTEPLILWSLYPTNNADKSFVLRVNGSDVLVRDNLGNNYPLTYAGDQVNIIDPPPYEPSLRDELVWDICCTLVPARAQYIELVIQSISGVQGPFILRRYI